MNAPNASTAKVYTMEEMKVLSPPEPIAISNRRLIELAKEYPPPSEWYDGDEEELFETL